MNWVMYLYRGRRWMLFVVVPMVVAGAAGYFYAAKQQKTYQATTTLYVQQAQNPAYGAGAGTDIQGSVDTAPTYAQMISSDYAVLEPSVDQVMATSFPGYRLSDHGVSAAQPPVTGTYIGSQIISINVTDSNPVRAAAAADAIGTAFVNRIAALQASRFATDERNLNKTLAAAKANLASITSRIDSYRGGPTGLAALKLTLSGYQSTYQLLLNSNQQLNIAKDAGQNVVSIYAPARVPKSPIGPHPLRDAALVAFLFMLLGAGGIFALNYFDDSLHTPEEIEKLAGAPVLGSVQRFESRSGKRPLISIDSPHSPATEAYRLIRTNIDYTNIDTPTRSILVTSSTPGEGKSTTASNLAKVIADGGKRVTLVDADLRRPSVHRIFGLNGSSQGLTSLLFAQTFVAPEAQFPGHANLVLVPSGPVPPNPADVLGSQRMRIVLDRLQGASDVIVVDSPPMLAVADAAILATLVDGVIIVVDPAIAKRRDVERTRQAIETVGGKVLGVVINRLSPRGSLYYYYSRHEYQYGSSNSIGPGTASREREKTAQSR